MKLFEIYRLGKYNKIFKTDVWHFDLAMWLHVFAKSMISVFIPIFLLQIGWELAEVILFYLIYTIFDSPLNFFARRLVSKIGARYAIILGTLAYIGFFASLSNLEVGNWILLIIMALLFAIYDTLYWVAHIYFFVGCEKNDDNISEGLSNLNIAKKFAATLSPIVGAVILIFYGRGALITASIIVFILSILPLFKIKYTLDKPENRPMSLKEFFRGGDGVREYIFQSLYAFHTVAEKIIWPIFIFTIFSTIESVAALPVIMAFTTMIFTYFVGKVEKANRTKTISIGAFFIAIVWVLRLIVENTIFYYASVFLMGLFGVLITIPMQSSIYENGERKDALAAATYRNFFSMLPRIFIFGILYALLEVFQVSFFMAIVSMFAVVFIGYAFKLRERVVS